MRHFLSKELRAPNVMTIPVNQDIVAEFQSLDPRTPGLGSWSPPWNSNIQWCSPTTPDTHRIFESAFERMEIAVHVRPYLDVENEVRLYAGFLIVRSECGAPTFHYDWDKTNNEAFTMLTPVSRNSHNFGLLYKTFRGDVAEYDYRRGEAIMFGDHFAHSTKPGKSDDPVVLLCFEFGTDKMEHWDKIYATIGEQAGMLRRPDGCFMQTGVAVPPHE